MSVEHETSEPVFDSSIRHDSVQNFDPGTVDRLSSILVEYGIDPDEAQGRAISAEARLQRGWITIENDKE